MRRRASQLATTPTSKRSIRLHVVLEEEEEAKKRAIALRAAASCKRTVLPPIAVPVGNFSSFSSSGSRAYSSVPDSTSTSTSDSALASSWSRSWSWSPPQRAARSSGRCGMTFSGKVTGDEIQGRSFATSATTFATLGPTRKTETSVQPRGWSRGEGSRGEGSRERISALQQIHQSLVRILNGMSRLPSVPPLWDQSSHPRRPYNGTNSAVDEGKFKEARQNLFEETRALITQVESGVQRGELTPSQRHGMEISHLMGLALQVFSDLGGSVEGGSLRECRRVMQLMKEWNLNLQPSHSHYIVQAAAREGLWKDASEMFITMVDPDASGYAPLEISVRYPIGLYAIARNAQSRQNHAAPAESVMEAVLRMTIVSPVDQDKYVLAAGNALGRAGESEALIEYLKHSYNSSRLGQSLVAAAMQACMLDSRPQKAIELYNDLTGGEEFAMGREWQWGGGSFELHPVTLDLAMRVMGVEEGNSRRALELFHQQVEERGMQHSMEAAYGVIEACERDRDWKNAVHVFLGFLEKDRKAVAEGDELKIVPIVEGTPLRDSYNPTWDLRRMLASTMRACNSCGEFGSALVVFRFFEVSAWGREAIQQSKPPPLERKTLFSRTLEAIDDEGEILKVIMSSLCGLRCPDLAMELYNEMERVQGVTLSEDANLCNQHAIALDHTLKSSLTDRSWESAYRHIHRLTSVYGDLTSRPNVLPTANQMELLLAGLGLAMKCSTSAGQPGASLMLAQRWQSFFDRFSRKSSGLRQAFGSLFGGNSDNSPKDGNAIMVSTDSVLSETMRAYRESGLLKEALALYDVTRKSKDHSLPFSSSTNEAISALLQERRNGEASALFHEEAATRNASTYILMAKGMEFGRGWDHIGDAYRVALRSGCLSEDFALLTMKYVAGANFDGKLRILRGIVKEGSRTVGVEKRKWLESHYWSTKRTIGFHHARLLMWWNDEYSGALEELALALQQFENKRKSGLTPKNDVVRAIVGNVKEYGPISDIPYEGAPRDRTEWIQLLLNIFDQVQHAPMWMDANFIDDASVGLRRLGADYECVEFVNNAIARNVRVGHIALLAALEAANSADLVISGDLALLAPPPQTMNPPPTMQND